MARIRSIKPEFFTSATVAKLPFRAALTFIGLWIYVDDEGRGRDDVRLIKATIWPQRDDVTMDDITDDLRELNTLELVHRYEKNGMKLLCIRNWKEHQRINRKTKSKLPRPPAPTGKLSERSLFSQLNAPQEVEVGSGSGKGKGSGSGTREAPDVSGVSAESNGNRNGRVHAHDSEDEHPAKRILEDLAAKKTMP